MMEPSLERRGRVFETTDVPRIADGETKNGVLGKTVGGEEALNGNAASASRA